MVSYFIPFSLLAIGNSQNPNQELTISLRVTIIVAGRDQTKSKKPFQNHEYIQSFI
tara:strand:- start:403 stop:570 length:168 start_codon:yes stop_codon:yes gene_type:complete